MAVVTWTAQRWAQQSHGNKAHFLKAEKRNVCTTGIQLSTADKASHTPLRSQMAAGTATEIAMLASYCRIHNEVARWQMPQVVADATK